VLYHVLNGGNTRIRLFHKALKTASLSSFAATG
jgi:hypothetical protein